MHGEEQVVQECVVLVRILYTIPLCDRNTYDVLCPLQKLLSYSCLSVWLPCG